MQDESRLEALFYEKLEAGLAVNRNARAIACVFLFAGFLAHCGILTAMSAGQLSGNLGRCHCFAMEPDCHMTTVSRSALVRHSAEEMFDLVDDVRSYQEFLPWVKRSREIERNEDMVCGELLFSKAGFEKSFVTRNRRQPGKMIEIRLVEGPFRQLEGFWRFQPLGHGGCKVSVDLEFEFSSRLLGAAFGRVFTQVAGTLVDSFVRRANTVYGRG